MKYTESEQDQIEAILYFEYRIDKALYIVQGKNQELRVYADNVEGWLNKVREVWELHKVR
jgi:hypothetical protein